LPTSEEIGKRLESVLGPVVPKENTMSSLIAGPSDFQKERERAAKGGELGGELLAPGGQIKLASKVAKPVISATKEIIKAGKDLPVGMSIKAVDESLDPLGFYSAASKAVDNIAQEKGTGQQFLAQIEKTPGVKKEELLWTGLDDFLKGKKTVTKAEVQEFLNANRVEVQEVTLAQDNPYPYRNANDWQNAINREERFGNFDEAERIMAAWERFELGSGDSGADMTKFAKYTMPGGENYREILLTLPAKQTGPSQISFKTTEDADNFLTDMSIQGYENLPYGRLNDTNVVQFDEAIPSNVMAFIRNNDGEIISGKSSAGSTYGSPHFEQPNVLAHMRVNDRVDADGKKVLFVEEVQSDWHQAGRKKGYAVKQAPQDLEIRKTENGYGVFDKNKNNLISEHLTEAKASDSMSRVLEAQPTTTTGVPDAPFKTSWHELALKRAIQLASEGGYDRIAFTTGKTQAERYDLSKQIDEVYYNRSMKAFGAYKDGKAVIMQNNVEPGDLEEIIGKDVAKKLLDAPIEKPTQKGAENFEMQRLKGQELVVGGEGMKGFYDTILPKYLDKYGKKWDAKVGMTEIQTSNVNLDNKIIFEDGKYLVDAGDGLNYNSYDTKAEAIKSLGGDNPSVHYMDITPKMKESVLTKGQPLFQMAPAIPAGVAAGQQEDNK
jgi:hypothetical protein